MEGQEKNYERIEQEKKEIKKDLEKNKNEVINFLINSVLEVDMTIPDVVKGQFSAKMGTSK